MPVRLLTRDKKVAEGHLNQPASLLHSDSLAQMAQQCHHSSRHSRGFPSCADVAPDLTFQKPDFAEGAETIALLGLLGRYSSRPSQLGRVVLPRDKSFGFWVTSRVGQNARSAWR
jgi:hypothetical protein